MGKIKTVIMGDLAAEEEARQKRETKREQKKQSKQAKKNSDETDVTNLDSSSTSTVAVQDIKTSKTQDQEIPSSNFKKSKKDQQVNKFRFPLGKKYVAALSLVDKNKSYSPAEAISLVKKTSFSKFDGSVELHLNVSEKGLRGSTELPHGTGKQIRVKIATDELISQLSASPKIDFDVLVASPDMMPKLARVAKILGPKGLMPNPKTNTISANPSQLVKTLSSSVSWKTQADLPIIHTVVGKVSFEDRKLEENLQSFLKSVGKEKIKSAFMKATMGPSIRIQI